MHPQLKIHITQNQHTQKIKPGLVASYIWPRNGDYSGRMGRDGNARK